MIDFLLILYPICILAVALFSCKIAKHGSFAVEMWDKTQSKMLQILACFMVIIHHLTQSISGYGSINRGPITIFSSMGILFTSIFFFFSGFGLIHSVYHNPTYLKRFLWHRLPIILVPFFTANAVYILIRVFYYHLPMDIFDVTKCLLGLILINGNGWYIVEIFLLYLIFYILFSLIKKKDIALLFLCIAACFLIFIGYQNGHDTSTLGNHWFMGEWWYNATIVFIMGALFARFETACRSYMTKHYNKLLIICIPLFIVLFYVQEYVRNVYGYYVETSISKGFRAKTITLFAQMVVCLLFTFLILLFNMKITIGNRISKAMSKISLELFLIHGIYVTTLTDGKIKNPLLLYGTVIVCGIISAFLIHMINTPIINFIQNCSSEKDYIDTCAMDLLRQKREKKLARTKYSILIIFILLLFVSSVFAIYIKLIRTPGEYHKEITTLKSASIGDIVYYGRYDTNLIKTGSERIAWIVADKTSTSVTLVSKKGLFGSSYNQKHTEISWENSDLRTYLNDEFYFDLCSDYEQKNIVKNDVGDVVSLLTVQEANAFFEKDIDRQLALTQAAEKYGTNVNRMSKTNNWDMKDYRSSWWWLRGDTTAITAPIVTVDGTISTEEKTVNKPNGAIRPVIIVSIAE